jgi:hypothetical protein
VKSSAHVVRFYGMLKVPIGLKRQNSRPFLAKLLLASLLSVSAGNCQRDLADESGMIGVQMGTHSRSNMVAVYGTPCCDNSPYCNSNELVSLGSCVVSSRTKPATTSCRLYANVYSRNTQMPFVPQPEDAPRRGDKRPASYGL